MKRFLLSALAVFALVFAARWVVRALASDETKIRWQLESMAEGFNDTSNNACTAGLAPDFLDETYGADKELVRAGLAQLFFTRKDPATKSFLYRVVLPPESIVIHVRNDGEADIELVARFFEGHGEAEKVAWETRIDADFVERDGEWRVLRTNHETLSGRLLR